MRECTRCQGEGGLLVRPSKRLLHEHRRRCAEAMSARAPPLPPPGRQRVPCSACGGCGLVPGELPPPCTPHKVVIVGGGIGGAAAALALRQRGVCAVVHERDGSFEARSQGYGLTMQQGANALRMLGLENEGVFSIAHHSFLPDGTMLGSYGRAIHERTREAMGNGRGAEQRRNAHVPRQQLRARLLRELPAEALRWGSRLEACNIADGGGELLGIRTQAAWDPNSYCPGRTGSRRRRPHTTLTPASYRPHTALIPPSYRPHTGRTPPSYRPHTTLIPPSYRPHTALIPPSCRGNVWQWSHSPGLRDIAGGVFNGVKCPSRHSFPPLSRHRRGRTLFRRHGAPSAARGCRWHLVDGPRAGDVSPG